jgi:hypothetical protein
MEEKSEEKLIKNCHVENSKEKNLKREKNVRDSIMERRRERQFCL